MGPSVIEDELAMRVRFQIARRGGDQLTAFVKRGMQRRPTPARLEAAALLKSGQKRVREKRIAAILETGATELNFFGLQPSIKQLRGVKIWTRSCDALREEVTCFIREKICSGAGLNELNCSIR